MTTRDFTPIIFLVAAVFTMQTVAAQRFPMVDTGQVLCYDDVVNESDSS